MQYEPVKKTVRYTTWSEVRKKSCRSAKALTRDGIWTSVSHPVTHSVEVLVCHPLIGYICREDKL